MIQFVTILLGLTVGPQTVALAVDPAVARVEVRLDGQPAATLTEAPWRARVDFGERLEPRLLEAVAFDAAGEGIGSARQVVNYARSNYEAVLVLDALEAGGGRTGRVVWRAILGRDPRSIELALDGREVPVTRQGRFELPPVGSDRIHYLSAVLYFEDGRSARAELVFGGVYGDRSSTTLTAVPLLLPPGARLPPADEMQGWFRSGETPLRAFTTSDDPPKLMVLRDPDFGHSVRQLRRELARADALPLPAVIEVSHAVQFVPLSPVPGHAGHFRAVEVGSAKKRSGLWELVARLHPRQPIRGKRETWSSLAAAGRGATEGNRRRAAVLLLGRKPTNRGRLTPSQVVGYLRSVRVPHFIWAPRARDLPAFDPSVEANVYAGAPGLARLFDDLDHSLRSQRIVWLEGAHFPAQVEPTERLPAGFALAR